MAAGVDAVEAEMLARCRADAGHFGSNAGFENEKPGLSSATPDDSSDSSGYTEGAKPTISQLTTLRRITTKIPWLVYTVVFVELCERFSWYGTNQVFVNFIQQPLPPGSTTGASGETEQAGALGLGQQTSTGLTTFNQFWAYVCPLIGGWIADQYLGRYATIQWSILLALIGHICIIISAIPPVIQNPDGAIGAFAVGLVIMGMGTGGFKSNIAPLLAEQIQDRTMRLTKTDSGEWVISDPFVTISRVYLWFYFMVNVGSLIGGVGMSYSAYYVGFWLSYSLPTILFLFCPVILFLAKKRYILMPPTGSVLGNAFKLISMGMKKKASLNPVKFYKGLKDPTFWHEVKPSNIPESERPPWMSTIDDQWVDQVRRGLSACKVFLWYPLYWLSYNQMLNNLISQAATMERDNVPNDVLSNFNPLTLVLFIPIMDKFIYPALRKARIRFTPIKRITFGFFLGMAAMIAATVTQYYIYKLHPCGDEPNSCEGQVAPISVWVQAVPYCLVAFSEIFASITGLEYAFTKAPENMRSVVQGVFLLQSAFASALNQALVPLATDPLLIWNYGVVAVLSLIGGVGFWLTWYKLDKEEDYLNTLQETEFKGKRPPLQDPEMVNQPEHKH